jgi:pimeloyl-ACP methyl ester carboxylesterase
VPHFEIEGAKIHYVDSGEQTEQKLSIVFVHGAGSSQEVWALQMEEFGKKYRCITIDLSGHGNSGPGPEETSIEEGFAYELAGLIEHLSLSDFVLIGHSMGGGVVMSYVLNDAFPRPKALVLVDTSCDLDLAKLGAGMTLETFDTFLEILRDKIKGRNKKAMEIIEREERMKIKNPFIMQRDIAAVDGFDITARVHEIDLPTLVLVGADDDIITPVIAGALEKKLPRGDIAVIKKADHVPMLQNPEEFNRILGKFLAWTENLQR